MKGGMEKYFQRLVGDMFVEYRGFRAERSGNKLLWKDKTYSTITEWHGAVDDWIREGGEIIQNSLNRKK